MSEAPVEAADVRTAQRADAQRSARGRSARRGQSTVLAVVAAGGALGTTARYAASLLWPAGGADFPWATLTVNVIGCAVIGVFLAVIGAMRTPHRLLRPFFGTGVLGGFTTFSTYAVDIRSLTAAGEARTGLVYLAATLLAALAAVTAGAWTTRWLLARRARCAP